MSDNGAKMISTSILFLAGCLSVSSASHSDWSIFGVVIVVVSGFMFIGAYGSRPGTSSLPSGSRSLPGHCPKCFHHITKDDSVCPECETALHTGEE